MSYFPLLILFAIIFRNQFTPLRLTKFNPHLTKWNVNKRLRFISSKWNFMRILKSSYPLGRKRHQLFGKYNQLLVTRISIIANVKRLNHNCSWEYVCVLNFYLIPKNVKIWQRWLKYEVYELVRWWCLLFSLSCHYACVDYAAMLKML